MPRDATQQKEEIGAGGSDSVMPRRCGLALSSVPCTGYVPWRFLCLVLLVALTALPPVGLGWSVGAPTIKATEVRPSGGGDPQQALANLQARTVARLYATFDRQTGVARFVMPYHATDRLPYTPTAAEIGDPWQSPVASSIKTAPSSVYAAPPKNCACCMPNPMSSAALPICASPRYTAAFPSLGAS